MRYNFEVVHLSNWDESEDSRQVEKFSLELWDEQTANNICLMLEDDNSVRSATYEEDFK